MEDSAASSRDPTEFLKLQPKKSILKAKQPSFDTHGRQMSQDDDQKKAHYDEMNILATHHPADKDYGHMKIDEPKTPYHAFSDSEEDSTASQSRPRRVSLVGNAVDAEELCKGLAAAASGNYSRKLSSGGSMAEDEEMDEADMTPEQLAHKREFEKKRKMHYDEGSALRRAKELLAQEEGEE
ncbi:unnamed protein product [Bursaphelenchus okinawaensis]|uniref:Protein phosphatase inhibitor 2 n=1 Tax=Bursaphelenchus okinawaensis TaxID=465554 RepID=A0A811KXJ3_9BILA|nr:unnamed protein product [Bursaphelenchus okinawaensis]CAG9112687.1 unnamed protein product [Bursaphelenchus okinawaensis]